jgi:hypothetical protein
VSKCSAFGSSAGPRCHTRWPVENQHGSCIREKLRGAKAAIEDDGRPMQERVARGLR